ncbi:MAG: signal peptidase I [Candidatus Yonathbacteria bacterium CG10_big_fil_rev_8_21_14_0_10_43_136]|uniref:Signal peptidase I n=1 Tax=Candidatus Yonathbacteria bacterium CG_4_10_14_0_8_um_filter_43_17 TaxID=1975099 RepID=A0A2M7Q564_9BACT|nr:MAG: signal peptidase I [Candidatus Yonathbacteria bacterium CG17_big_fil_post_rev_8_21_14_2_50_43_9]PIR40655.1 MAG: signal peptidase I [Candidatus Yonathbacteria bacterium CG10_big_fil_rev_8_21_14_0_10_43_136]PIX57214.1 MAG: signal peptidase I [Candidatus Yonathbacteria bacterium CG_4_10_14_3_um_filter_43_12]PIY58586.1 MAG: signal peptidase I [Candidatus Yonathbacteria bacterium CG_4_10_14_0_8_um_filter_43_17]PJC22360.1 MAG: signal peptidase I [Candidatus Yonathbacteria bacterium CG_4_9_14_
MSEEFTTPPPVPPVEPAVEKSHSFREEALETFRFLLIALVIVVPIRIFIAQPFIVSGASMDPTFKDKQYLIVDELSYHLNDPVRGDVAIFKYPKNPKQYFIKRVIGLPGETVLIDNDGNVLIKDKDGENIIELEESYVMYEKGGSLERTLLMDEYFMMGDNRSGSFDSRSWGPVGRDLFVGKAFLRLFPLSSIDILPGQFRQ